MSQETNGAPATAEGATITVNLPKGTDAREAARRAVKAGAALVLEKDIPVPANVAELFRMEEDGWPSVLAFPSPAGPVAFRLLISNSLEVREEMQKAAEQHGRDYTAWYELLKEKQKQINDAKSEYDASEDKDEPNARVKALLEESVDLLKDGQRIAEADYGRVFDTGVITGWKEEEIGLPFSRENFVSLATRSGGALVQGVRARFRQLVQPRLEVLDSEGEASSPGQDGTASSGG